MSVALPPASCNCAQRVLLNDVLQTAVESARGMIEARRHQLTVDVRAPDLAVEADPDRLVQVLSNLLANSAKYTQQGGCIRLTLESENHEAVPRREYVPA
jgi:signal transduction histidine kinase